MRNILIVFYCIAKHRCQKTKKMAVNIFLVYSNWIYSPEAPNSGQNWQFFVPRNLENWRMTLKINRAPLLYCLKLCASFHSHWCIQTGVTVQKRSICVKIGYFLPRVLISCLENTRYKVKISQWRSVLAVSISLTEFQLGMQTSNGRRFCSTQISVLFFLAWSMSTAVFK